MKKGFHNFQLFLEAARTPSPENLQVVVTYATEGGPIFADEIEVTLKQLKSQLESIQSQIDNILHNL